MTHKPSHNTRVRRGRTAFNSYLSECGMNVRSGEGKQDYTIGDCIADIMHYAAKRGFNPVELVEAAVGHWRAERQVTCCNCGNQMDHEKAFTLPDGDGEAVFCYEGCWLEFHSEEDKK